MAHSALSEPWHLNLVGLLYLYVELFAWTCCEKQLVLGHSLYNREVQCLSPQCSFQGPTLSVDSIYQKEAGQSGRKTECKVLCDVHHHKRELETSKSHQNLLQLKKKKKLWKV